MLPPSLAGEVEEAGGVTALGAGMSERADRDRDEDEREGEGANEHRLDEGHQARALREVRVHEETDRDARDPDRQHLPRVDLPAEAADERYQEDLEGARVEGRPCRYRAPDNGSTAPQ